MNTYVVKQNNLTFVRSLPPRTVDLVYADIIFDNPDLGWVLPLKPAMKSTGVLYIHTDRRAVERVLQEMREIGGFTLQTWIIWAYNWGGRPRNRWGNKHDDILFFSRSSEWPWYTKQVEIPKVTLINSTKTHQIPTDVWRMEQVDGVWDDIGSLHTTSKEKDDGERRQWQKPLALTDRICAAHPKRGRNQLVVDPVLGTGGLLVSAARYTQNLWGCDIDPEAVRITRRRVKKALKQHWED